MTPHLIAFEHIILMLSTSANWQVAFKWLATAFMAISALTVSFSVEWAGCSIAFVGFLMGHILWAMSAVPMKENALLALNVGFIPVDLYAMYIRL